MPEDKLYSEKEMLKIREQAVLEARLDEVFESIPALHSAIKVLNVSVNETKVAVNNIPTQMQACRNEVETKIRKYVDGEFVKERELEQKINEKLSSVIKDISRAKWTVSGFIVAATTFMILLRYTEIAKGIHG